MRDLRLVAASMERPDEALAARRVRAQPILREAIAV